MARIAVGLVLAGLLGVGVSRAHADGASWVELARPAPGENIRGVVPLVEVSGRGLVGFPDPYDLVVAIDLSESTLLPSGMDVDGDGTLGRVPARPGRKLAGRWSTDPDDNVAHAELLGTALLLERLRAKAARVGILTFAGGHRLRAPVGSPQEALSSLRRIRVRLDRSGTDVARAIRAGVRALLKAPEQERGGRQRILVLLTDGHPTRPRPAIFARRAAIRAAHYAADHGVRIFPFLIGAEALARGKLFAEMAQLTDGKLHRAQTPDEFAHVLLSLDSTSIDHVRIRNRTSGATARAFRSFPDGAFDGLVPLVPGENELEVTTQTTDGALHVLRRTVFFDPASAASRSDLALAKSLRDRTLETELMVHARLGAPTRRLKLRVEED